MRMARLRITALRLDSGVQSRVEISAFTVDEYAEAIRRGEKLPPITVFFDGKAHWVSDGFHRALAAEQAGKKTVEAEVRKGSRRDAVLHSAGSNSKHGLPRTNADKRRAVLLLLSDKEWGRWSNREIARRCAVSEFLVRQAREAICDKIADERTAIRNGKTYTLRTSRIGITQRIAPNVRELIRQTPLIENRNELERIASLAPDEQLKVVQKIAAGEAANVEFAILKMRREGRQLRLRQELPDLNRLGRFRTVVLDPPWDLPKGGRLSPSQHYETMPLDEIQALPIAELAADDAHLYVWAVHGFMAEAFSLISEWGFRFITTLTWVKTRRDGKGLSIGPGHYFRGCAEHLLFAVRGDLPSLRNDQPNVFLAPRGRHSAKPDVAYELVERISPSPYIEVFSRRRRDGWVVWGNEV